VQRGLPLSIFRRDLVPKTQNLPQWKEPKLVDDMDAPEPLPTAIINGRRVVAGALPFDWWVDHHGNVVMVAISTNRVMKDFDEGYQSAREKECRAAGWKQLYELTDEQFDEMVDKGRAQAAKENEAYFPLTPEGAKLLSEQQQQKFADALIKGNMAAIRALLLEVLPSAVASQAQLPREKPAKEPK
jgi:hypothetical protein